MNCATQGMQKCMSKLFKCFKCDCGFCVCAVTPHVQRGSELTSLNLCTKNCTDGQSLLPLPCAQSPCNRRRKSKSTASIIFGELCWVRAQSSLLQKKFSTAAELVPDHVCFPVRLAEGFPLAAVFSCQMSRKRVFRILMYFSDLPCPVRTLRSFRHPTACCLSLLGACLLCCALCQHRNDDVPFQCVLLGLSCGVHAFPVDVISIPSFRNVYKYIYIYIADLDISMRFVRHSCDHTCFPVPSCFS